MLRRAVDSHRGCDGIVLGGHGLFTWGDTQRECYANSIKTIDQMGEFIDGSGAGEPSRPAFGGVAGGGDGRSRRRWRPSCSRFYAASSRRIAAWSRTGIDPTMRSRSPIRTGRRSSARSARAVPITSCARASARCSCRGMPRRETVATLQQRITRARGVVSRRRTRRTTIVRRRELAAPARLESVGGRDSRRSASSDSRKTSARRASRPSSSSTPFT